MKSEKVTVGVVGCGNWCRRYHLPILTETMADQYELKGVCDAMPEAAREVSEQTGVPWFESVESLIDGADPDLIYVVTRPASTHYPVAMAALEAGKHVFLEKPMAATAVECDELIAKAEGAGRILAVHQNRRWEIPFLAAKRIIDEGRVGEPYYVLNNHPCVWRGPADLLMDWGVHIADQALLFGGDAKPVEVSCLAVNPAEVESLSGPWRASIRFADNLVVDLFQMLTAPGALPAYMVCGSEGSCVIPPGGLQNETCSVKVEIAGIQRGREGEDEGPFTLNFDLEHYHELLRAALVGEGALPVDAKQSRNAVKLVNLMAESARKRETIKIDADAWV